jgi:diguanylate cyclase (GGDEF)-like protein
MKNKSMKTLVCFLSALLWVAGSVVHAGHGLIEGTPLMKRYLPQEYASSAGNEAIAIDKRGRVYIANQEGVLRFDGTQWELIELAKRSNTRDIKVGRNGKFYVAGYDTFGVLVDDKNGQTRYQDLSQHAGFDRNKNPVGIVWTVVETAKGVYFQAEDFLYFLDYEHKNARYWPIDKDVRTFFGYKNTLYVRIQDKGFSQFVEGKLTLVKGGEKFKDLAVDAVINKGDWALLVTSEGFYRMDESGIRFMSTLNLTRPENLQIAYADVLSDGGLVIATEQGELYRYDKTLHFQQKVKIGNAAIQEIEADTSGGLWVVTDADIVRLAMPAPWSYFGEPHGLYGDIYDFEWYRNALWYVGSNGIGKIDADNHSQNKAQSLPWITQEAFVIQTDGESLLVGHRNGLLVLDEKSQTPRHLKTPNDEAVLYFLKEKNNADFIYAVCDHTLLLLSKRPGQWQILRQYSLGQLDPIAPIQIRENEIWLGNTRGQPERWQIDPNSLEIISKKRFGKSDGLPEENDGTQRIYAYEKQVYAVVADKNYVFNGSRFEQNEKPPFNLISRPHEMTVLENEKDAYAYTSREILHKAKNTQNWKVLRSGLSNSAGYNNLKMNSDGVLRMKSWDGILQYISQADTQISSPPKLSFAYVNATSADDKVIVPLPADTKAEMASVPPGYNMKLRFEMVNLESGAEYRYRLKQVSANWSAWSDRDLFIRALPPGQYDFELQAKTRAGQTVDPIVYRFEVLPFWYQRLWVKILGLLLILGSIALMSYSFIRARTARYREDNAKLEQRISERTQQLESANQRLSELAIEDPLTGVANRRALEQGLQREWFRCMDQNQCLSAMMIDVDHFKRYNDKHGHLEGDNVLREIAQSLQFEHDSQRELFARFGGEEFALLLPGISLEETLRRAELIRNKISKFPNNITVSIGVAGFVPSLHMEKNSLLRRADAALYRAKRLGRNRVEADSD